VNASQTHQENVLFFFEDAQDSHEEKWEDSAWAGRSPGVFHLWGGFPKTQRRTIVLKAVFLFLCNRDLGGFSNDGRATFLRPLLLFL
jgi:hypothetical protein